MFAGQGIRLLLYGALLLHLTENLHSGKMLLQSKLSHPVFTCLKLTIGTLEQGPMTSFWCLYCQLWTCFTPWSRHREDFSLEKRLQGIVTKTGNDNKQAQTSTNYCKPLANDHKPLTNNHKPLANDHKPPINDHKPPVNNH